MLREIPEYSRSWPPCYIYLKLVIPANIEQQNNISSCTGLLSKLRLANGSSQTMTENSDITMLRAAAVCTTVRYIYEIKRTPPQLTIVFQWTSVSQLTSEFSSYNRSKRTFGISSTYFYDPDVLSSHPTNSANSHTSKILCEVNSNIAASTKLNWRWNQSKTKLLDKWKKAYRLKGTDFPHQKFCKMTASSGNRLLLKLYREANYSISERLNVTDH